MSTILITGGTGFIGSNLAAALIREGHSVRILRRHTSSLSSVSDLPLEHCLGDVRDVESLRNAARGCDFVYHTAAIIAFWKPQHGIQYEINVVGTRNVVEACLRENVRRLIHTSSVAAIGFPATGGHADETNEYNWHTFGNNYKASKHLSEIEVQKGVAKGLDAVIVNPSVVIGPGDVHFNGGSIIRSVRKYHVPAYIKGGMNVAFVDDVVRGHVGAAQKGKIGERYILGGENLTHKQIFQITAEIIGGYVPQVELPISFLKIAAKAFDLAGALTNRHPLITSELISGAGLNNWYSSAKAQRELGYTITPFRKAVEITYQWYVSMGLLS